MLFELRGLVARKRKNRHETSNLLLVLCLSVAQNQKSRHHFEGITLSTSLFVARKWKMRHKLSFR